MDVSGTVLPLRYDSAYKLHRRPSAGCRPPELFFNAARLDRSLAVRTADWAALTHPRVSDIISQ